jgi:hypothetical protein
MNPLTHFKKILILPLLIPLALVVRANPPVIETIPPHPGPPWYANFSADFIPTDDGMVAIAFIREPSCIPTDFNLLLWLDPPAAFGCELTIEGKVWWHDPETDPYPFQTRVWGWAQCPSTSWTRPS